MHVLVLITEERERKHRARSLDFNGEFSVSAGRNGIGRTFLHYESSCHRGIVLIHDNSGAQQRLGLSHRLCCRRRLSFFCDNGNILAIDLVRNILSGKNAVERILD